MFIRPITREDLPQAVAISNSIFRNDELFAWLFPRQHVYPDDLRRFQFLRFRTRLMMVGCHGFVMVTEESDPYWTGKEEVVGYAFFERTGDDAAAQKWRQDTIFRKIERYLLSWEKYYEDHMLDRITDRVRLKAYIKNIDDGFYDKFKSRWHLGVLGVSQEFQRRGIGGKLVRYGLKIAADENVPMTLEASIMGRGLYEKCSFKVVKEVEVAEGLNEVTMLWEPEVRAEDAQSGKGGATDQ
ncbi:acyl-CoA N-acyltransferase [Lojkania enalia]|uniref:Acyl-CoA N-acyltransferase n=1 Tax=Lojkania enalia TaxID=147567 RepID=A0A9P4K115_9PLEO|nr:acyl-CoA N-acyltransferase [Didymosphaeria enalia]